LIAEYREQARRLHANYELLDPRGAPMQIEQIVATKTPPAWV